MVFFSLLRLARTPLIKFRGRVGPEASYKALGAKGITPPKAVAKSTPAPKAVQTVAQKAAPKSAPTPGKAAATIAKGQTIEDWELPARYRRLPFDMYEIEYINCGGSPTIGLPKKAPPKKGAKKPAKPAAKKPKKK